MLNFLSICSGTPLFVLLFEETAIRYVYTILVSPRTCYYNCVTPRATGAAALKSKIASREHKIEFLRHTVLEFQALQAKVPERPSVRPSGVISLTYTLDARLIFFINFAFFVENHLLGNTKLSFLVLWFKRYRPCRQRALYFSLCLHSLLKITY